MPPPFDNFPIFIEFADGIPGSSDCYIFSNTSYQSYTIFYPHYIASKNASHWCSEVSFMTIMDDDIMSVRYSSSSIMLTTNVDNDIWQRIIPSNNICYHLAAFEIQ